MATLFRNTGVHCVVDGQFGSTGKGALSAWLAQQTVETEQVLNFAGAIYSGGPNSGHTSYLDGKKIVVKQLPTFSVHLSMRERVMPVYLSAGAIIDRDILKKEAETYPNIPIFVHPNAAIVTDEDRAAEMTGSIAEVAGTRSGTGAALIRKIRREPAAIAKNSLGEIAKNVVLQNHRLKPNQQAYFMEVAQGFSLGINSEFYPKVTSRECTVMQGMADARIPANYLSRTYMAIRTFPIRVGNVDGHSSGDWYDDQEEVDWNSIGVEPELTTVTQRVRRIATFSNTQFYEACHANHPNFVFVSHMDYLPNMPDQIDFINNLLEVRESIDIPFQILISFGPHVKDISYL